MTPSVRAVLYEVAVDAWLWLLGCGWAVDDASLMPSTQSD